MNWQIFCIDERIWSRSLAFKPSYNYYTPQMIWQISSSFAFKQKSGKLMQIYLLYWMLNEIITFSWLWNFRWNFFKKNSMKREIMEFFHENFMRFSKNFTKNSKNFKKCRIIISNFHPSLMIPSNQA